MKPGPFRKKTTIQRINSGEYARSKNPEIKPEIPEIISLKNRHLEFFGDAIWAAVVAQKIYLQKIPLRKAQIWNSNAFMCLIAREIGVKANRGDHFEIYVAKKFLAEGFSPIEKLVEKFCIYEPTK